MQGSPPEHMHVLLGVGEQRALRYDDFRRSTSGCAAVRGGDRRADGDRALPRRALLALRLSRRVCGALGGRRPPSAGRRRARRDQVMRLREAGLPTLAALARAAPDTKIADIPEHAFESLRDQAALQLERRTTGRLDWHAVDADTGCGFELLPRPSAGDVSSTSRAIRSGSRPAACTSSSGCSCARAPTGSTATYGRTTGRRERRLFETFVDLVHERLARDPGMHVYHYGAYEKAAIPQLMGIYATREDAVDELRAGRSS